MTDIEKQKSLNDLCSDLVGSLLTDEVLKQAAHHACHYGSVAHKTYLDGDKIKVEIVESNPCHPTT
jgi:inorganic pyrophosphatase